MGTTDFQQSVPKRDMLYLDKAWSLLQKVTAPTDGADKPRPAHRMFEGHVTYNDDWGWDGWVRALTPDEVAEIARDLESIDDGDAMERIRGAVRSDQDPDAEARYGRQHLRSARDFTMELAAHGRGMVYLIG